jgi:Biotin-requiring enzyme
LGAEDTAAQAFIRQLAMLVDVVGSPSLKRLEAVSKKRARDRGHQAIWIKRTTLDDYLRGKRRKIPGWPLVREVLIACKKVAEEDGFVWSPDALGSDAEWQALWDGARHGIVLTESPIKMAEIGRSPISHSEAVPDPPGDASVDHLSADFSPEVETEIENGGPAVTSGSHRRTGHAPIVTRATHTVCVPELSEGGGWVTVVKWHRWLGDHVRAGEPLVELETEMVVTLELPSPVAGVVEDVLAAQGETIPAGQALCILHIERPS